MIDGVNSGGSYTRGRNQDQSRKRAIKKRQENRKLIEQLSDFDKIFKDILESKK